MFENLTAALRLGERMLKSCKTVDEFNLSLLNSHRPRGDGVKFESWREQEFGKAKAHLASGEGLGKDFIKHFLGERKGMKNDTLQTVIDSYYAESRKAAAFKREPAKRGNGWPMPAGES